MAISPFDGSTGPLSISITCDGTPMPDTARLVSVQIRHGFNRIPSAVVSFVDGDMADGEFPSSDSDIFKPGAKLTISAGYDQVEKRLFTGVVIKHAISIDSTNKVRLVLECRDQALKMTVGRNNANHVDKTDSDIISALIAANGLTADVKATTVSHKELVQYYVSDWDYMMARAEINGLLVTVEDGKVSVKPPDGSTEPVLSLTYGSDIISFEAEMDARWQLSKVTGVSWDPATQAVIEQSANPETLAAQGEIDGAALAKVLGVSDYRLQSAATQQAGSLTAWTKAQQTRAALARIRGRVSFQGNATAKPGVVLELARAGKHFNGNIIATHVTQVLEDGNWRTDVEFGMPTYWFAEEHQLHAPEAAGLTAAIGGLHVGVVMKLDADPEGQYKIQVNVPLMKAQTAGVWARLASFYGSSGFGAFIIPEIGDEVVLGFFNNDPSHPVILGSLYSSKRMPAYELTAENNIKALVTRSKLKMEFDDDKKVITLITPGNNKIVISDDAKSILLQDQNNNKVELSPTGILLDSPKDITISAKGKVAISAVNNVTVSSVADVKIDGLNIAQTAQIGFTAKGSASAELSAAGQTVVKGALVMIN